MAGMEPFDPGVVPSGGGGGYGTSLLNSAAPAAAYVQQPMFVGWAKTPGRLNRGDLSRGRGLEETEPSVPGDHERNPVLLTPFQLLQAFDGFNRDEYLRFRNKMIAAGLVPDQATAIDVRDTYEKLLDQVGQLQQQGAYELSPMDFVNNLIRQNGFNPKDIKATEDFSASGGEPKTWTNTQNSVYDLTPQVARQTLEQAVQQKLGRAPTQAEMEDFIDAARTRAENNPTVVTTEGSTDASGNTTTTTHATPGFGAEQAASMAERRAENAPDYKSYQAVATYFPALMSALGSTV